MTKENAELKLKNQELNFNITQKIEEDTEFKEKIKALQLKINNQINQINQINPYNYNNSLKINELYEKIVDLQEK